MRTLMYHLMSFVVLAMFVSPTAVLAEAADNQEKLHAMFATFDKDSTFESKYDLSNDRRVESVTAQFGNWVITWRFERNFNNEYFKSCSFYIEDPEYRLTVFVDNDCNGILDVYARKPVQDQPLAALPLVSEEQFVEVVDLLVAIQAPVMAMRGVSTWPTMRDTYDRAHTFESGRLTASIIQRVHAGFGTESGPIVVPFNLPGRQVRFGAAYTAETGLYSNCSIMVKHPAMDTSSHYVSPLCRGSFTFLTKDGVEFAKIKQRGEILAETIRDWLRPVNELAEVPLKIQGVAWLHEW